MATIKPIEGRSIHQIQSGQVIVDLCSVIKELVENSLDAGATSIEVRFKSNGLDSIEVQDNGHGIAPADYDTIALKHYTSKLSSYDDLTSLETFGFRGEALSSLCALSNLHIVTARASDGPRGTRLDFEVSGKLKGTSMVASQKGTTVAVENLFYNLPVRRRELEKNIKREYGKVLGVLHAYACISTGVRFAVSNQVAKGKKITVFSTKANTTTKENIANVYGAKTMLALLPLELKLEMQPANGPSQSARIWSAQDDVHSREVEVSGHISRPVVGEGRQTPDRQMFFVNSRPCGLPQIAKAFNEVYKSYNLTQSPFIFANFKMDTNAYDVNVSPDKRTIFLHDQAALLESLKSSLIELFDAHDQSVPQSQLFAPKVTAYKPLTLNREASASHQPRETYTTAALGNPAVATAESELTTSSSFDDTPAVTTNGTSVSLIQKFVGRDSNDRNEALVPPAKVQSLSKDKQNLARSLAGKTDVDQPEDGDDFYSTAEIANRNRTLPRAVQDFNDRIASQQAKEIRENPANAISMDDEETIPAITSTPQRSTPGAVQNAFDRMRPKRTPAETATITIGDATTITTIGTPPKRRRIHTPKASLAKGKDTSSPLFGRSLLAFAAPGTQLGDVAEAQEGGSAEDETDEASSHPITSLGITAREPGKEADAIQDDGSDEETEDDRSQPLFVQQEEDSDHEYINDAEKKAREEARVAQMIAEAEEAAAKPSLDNIKRANTALKGRPKRDSTLQLVRFLSTSVSRIEEGVSRLRDALNAYAQQRSREDVGEDDTMTEQSPEERLSLTVSKSDFAKMRIIGQFNLGFILATRPATTISTTGTQSAQHTQPDELFIVDQHASDEKYNFERLQSETIVQNQRLVHPRQLELTAIEEEIILDHPDALVKNGFQIETDTSGEAPVGQRCRLVSLPMSREVVFDTRDLEELLALLGEQAGSGVPRPSKVRKMFAMRACRSSIMVGKTLTAKQMERVVRHMGEIDKPWNCPHGRPTMRHLYGLDAWDGWREGDGLVGLADERTSRTDWAEYARTSKRKGLLHVDSPSDHIVES